MDGNKKEGVSVKEIEQFAKKHRFEVFFCLMFLLACIFGILGAFSPGWSVFLGMVGGILGIILPAKAGPMIEKMIHFVFKQDTTMQIIFGVIGLILAAVLPFVIFLIIGIAGGKAIHQMVSSMLPK